MLNELQRKSIILSLEAQHNAVSLESAFRQLPMFLTQIKTHLSSWSGSLKFSNFVFNLSDGSAFARKIAKTKYTDFKEVTLFVPQGMNVTYLQYVGALTASVDMILDAEANYIDPYIKWLGERLGRPDTLRSIASSFNPAFKSDSLDKAQVKIDECFVKAGQKHSEVKYFTAISRQADWPAVSDALTALQTRCGDDLHKRLMGKMAILNDYLTTLTKRIETDKDTYVMSPSALSGLAVGAYTAASILEFYGITRYRIDELAHAVNDSIVKLNKFT